MYISMAVKKISFLLFLCMFFYAQMTAKEYTLTVNAGNFKYKDNICYLGTRNQTEGSLKTDYCDFLFTLDNNWGVSSSSPYPIYTPSSKSASAILTCANVLTGYSIKIKTFSITVKRVNQNSILNCYFKSDEKYTTFTPTLNDFVTCSNIEELSIYDDGHLTISFEKDKFYISKISIGYEVYPKITASAKLTFNNENLYFTTYCSPCNFRLSEGATAYKAYTNDNKVYAVALPTGSVYPAGKGLMISSQSETFNVIPTDEQSTADLTGNELKGVYQQTQVSDILSSNQVMLILAKDGAFKYYTGSYVPQNKAFFVFPAASAPSRLDIFPSSVATDIEEAKNEVNNKYNKKLIQDQLFIFNENGTYDIMGRKVK